jgi:6-pyruvoyltetrahydropterin/6-carboxytetrahydropterin synthase
MELTKEYRVEYAHRLKDHMGLCRNLHGHSGRIIVTFSGLPKKDTGMIVDFKEFGWLKDIIDVLDHATILQVTDPLLDILSAAVSQNKIDDMRLVVVEGPPTAENLCTSLAKSISDSISANSIPGSFLLHSVSFYETEKNCVTLVY